MQHHQLNSREAQRSIILVRVAVISGAKANCKRFSVYCKVSDLNCFRENYWDGGWRSCSARLVACAGYFAFGQTKLLPCHAQVEERRGYFKSQYMDSCFSGGITTGYRMHTSTVSHRRYQLPGTWYQRCTRRQTAKAYTTPTVV